MSLKWLKILTCIASAVLTLYFLPAIVILIALIVPTNWFRKNKSNTTCAKSTEQAPKTIFFSNKVASALFKKGYTPQDMPPNNVFKPLCDALQENGYNTQQAADLWDKCFYEDKDAIKEMYKNTGVYGKLILGPLE